MWNYFGWWRRFILGVSRRTGIRIDRTGRLQVLPFMARFKGAFRDHAGTLSISSILAVG